MYLNGVEWLSVRLLHTGSLKSAGDHNAEALFDAEQIDGSYGEVDIKLAFETCTKLQS